MIIKASIGRIIVKLEDKKNSGGILLPESAKDYLIGEIASVGEHGNPQFKVGDKVIFGKIGKFFVEDFVVLREQDIWGSVIN